MRDIKDRYQMELTEDEFFLVLNSVYHRKNMVNVNEEGYNRLGRLIEKLDKVYFNIEKTNNNIKIAGGQENKK